MEGILAAAFWSLSFCNALGANEPTPPDSQASSSEWLSLDRELEARLASRRVQTTQAFEVHGYVRINLTHTDDIDIAPPDDGLTGFLFDNIRVYMFGDIAGYGIFLQLAAANATIEVLDAFVYRHFNEHITGTLGQFKSPFLWSGMLEPNRLLFIPYTASGSIWSERDLGVQANGQEGRFRWWAAYQNGSDGAADRGKVTGRLAVHALGDDYTQERLVEGALGAPEGTNLEIGLGLSDDDSVEDDGGDAIGGDLVFTLDRIYFHAEVLSNPDDPDLGFRANSSPVSVTASYLLVPDKYEVAARYENLRDTAETDGYFIGVNRYFVGHDVKLQVNFADIDASSPGSDTQTISVGLSAGI
jgi:hypothetical protein